MADKGIIQCNGLVYKEYTAEFRIHWSQMSSDKILLVGKFFDPNSPNEVCIDTEIKVVAGDCFETPHTTGGRMMFATPEGAVRTATTYLGSKAFIKYCDYVERHIAKEPMKLLKEHLVEISSAFTPAE